MLNFLFLTRNFILGTRNDFPLEALSCCQAGCKKSSAICKSGCFQLSSPSRYYQDSLLLTAGRSWEPLAPHLLLEDMQQAEGEQHCLLCPKECAGNC